MSLSGDQKYEAQYKRYGQLDFSEESLSGSWSIPNGSGQITAYINQSSRSVDNLHHA